MQLVAIHFTSALRSPCLQMDPGNICVDRICQIPTICVFWRCSPGPRPGAHHARGLLAILRDLRDKETEVWSKLDLNLAPLFNTKKNLFFCDGLNC